MTDNELKMALYEAFLHAAKTLGPRAKGMSCFLRNWPKQVVIHEAEAVPHLLRAIPALM